MHFYDPFPAEEILQIVLNLSHFSALKFFNFIFLLKCSHLTNCTCKIVQNVAMCYKWFYKRPYKQRNLSFLDLTLSLENVLWLPFSISITVLFAFIHLISRASSFNNEKMHNLIDFGNNFPVSIAVFVQSINKTSSQTRHIKVCRTSFLFFWASLNELTLPSHLPFWVMSQ